MELFFVGLLGIAIIALAIYGTVLVAKSAIKAQTTAGKVWGRLAFAGLIFVGLAYIGTYQEVEEARDVAIKYYTEYQTMGEAVTKCNEMLNYLDAQGILPW